MHKGGISMYSKSMVTRFLETNSFMGEHKKEQISKALKRFSDETQPLVQNDLPELFADTVIEPSFWMQFETDHEMKRLGLKDMGFPV